MCESHCFFRNIGKKTSGRSFVDNLYIKIPTLSRNRSVIFRTLFVKNNMFVWARPGGGGGGGGALDFQMVGVCRWGVENRTLS